jgi:phosphoribosylanthranilate isomerase
MTNNAHQTFPHLALKGAKICGIRTKADYDHCADAGAAFVGMVFFEKSPRHLTFDEAKRLAQAARPDGPVRVALTVDATDTFIDDINAACQPDMFQLHGNESPARAAAIKARTNKPVMKAFRVKSPSDITQAEAYYDVVDWLLFDADSGNPDMPGGTGHQFDWSLVKDLAPPLPWMLAGGLKAETLPLALAQTPACYFDVSSAVEATKGVKDHGLITNFINAIK